MITEGKTKWSVPQAHIVNRKRISLHVHMWIHDWAKQNISRKKGETETVQCIVYALERRAMQGPRRPDRSPSKCTTLLTNSHAKETFQRLILDAASCATYRQWIKLSPSALRYRILNDKERQFVGQVTKKLQKLFDVRQHQAKTIATEWKHACLGKEFWKAWHAIERGREFFIKGLGGFQLSDPVVTHQLRYVKNIRDISVWGHMVKTESVSRFWHTDDVMREVSTVRRLYSGSPEYFVKWFKELVSCFNHGTVDEVFRMIPTPTHDKHCYGIPDASGLMDVSPHELYRRHQAIQAAQQEYWDYNNVDNVHRVVPGFSYPLEKVHKLKPDQMLMTWGDDMILAPVQTYGELIEVGEKLHNCARSYHQDMADERVTLFVLRHTANGPIALAEYSHQEKNWVQIKETCNRQPSKQTNQAFTAYRKEYL